MSEQIASAGMPDEQKPVSGSKAQGYVWDMKTILWSMPQPILVLGSGFLVATMVYFKWMNYRDYALLMILLPTPILIIAERLWAKRQDWILMSTAIEN